MVSTGGEQLLPMPTKIHEYSGCLYGWWGDVLHGVFVFGSGFGRQWCRSKFSSGRSTFVATNAKNHFKPCSIGKFGQWFSIEMAGRSGSHVYLHGNDGTSQFVCV